MNSDKNLDQLFIEAEEAVGLTSIEEKREFRRTSLQLDILHEIKKIMDKREINYTQLSEKLGKSKGFVSQLFSGDKKLNLDLIIRLQEILKVKVNFAFEDILIKTENSESRPSCFNPSSITSRA